MLPLDVPAQRSSLDALETCDSVRLLIDRARRFQPSFGLTAENAAPIAEICKRLDGLPLAIELAASQLRLLTPQGLLDRLARPLDS